MNAPYRAVQWRDGQVRLLDQKRLPLEVVYNDYADVESLARAIEDMTVRGAPAIGIAAAYGVALAAFQSADDLARLRARTLPDSIARLRRTRPTAVNLFWALDRMQRAAHGSAAGSVAAWRDELLHEARAIDAEDVVMCRKIGENGAPLLPDSGGVLTHCNAGALATSEYGTALSVITHAVHAGKDLKIYAGETRPLLQGARLTTWELQQAGLNPTLVTDNATAHLMQRGLIRAVVTGADRIAANGDAANKIGTYGLAVLAKHHGIPFYVAAPHSTIDFGCASGADIPIEQRSPDEVTIIRGVRVAPAGIAAVNPAFDVTPAVLITAIITEAGVAQPPSAESLRALYA